MENGLKMPDISHLFGMLGGAAKAKDSDEERAKRIEAAKQVHEALETEGGKRIREFLERLLELMDEKPEDLTRTVNGFREVDTYMVAHRGGSREALNAVINWFDQQKTILESSAKGSREKGFAGKTDPV